MMKYFALLALMVSMSLTSGCTCLKPNPERKILGQWTTSKTSIQFEANHQFVISHPGRSANGAWSYKGGTFELTLKKEETKNISDETAQGVIDAQGRLTITPPKGKVIVLTKTQQAKTK